MVQVLPSLHAPNKGERLAQALSSGTREMIDMYKQRQSMDKENASLKNQGIDITGISDPKLRQLYVASALKGASEKELTELKNQQKRQFVESIYGNRSPQQSNLSVGDPKQNEMDNKPENPEQPTNGLSNSPSERMKFSDKDIGMAMTVDPNIGRAMQAQNDITIREEREDRIAKEKLEAEDRKNRTAKEKAYFKYNEPKLSEVAGIERKIKVDNARFSRLENLFSDPSKFPNQTLAALMTKDGQLNDIAYSQLTPEAQEAVKLIIDSTSGIKDTYGARVTNFDLQTYLRKLPSLLTSPEGRMRVIKDLKAINDINSVYNEGIQEIFDKAGGSDQISFSEAEKRFKSKYADELQRKIDKFVSPTQTKFDSLPSAKDFLGKKMRDKATGEMFISDGIEWKPFKE